MNTNANCPARVMSQLVGRGLGLLLATFWFSVQAAEVTWTGGGVGTNTGWLVATNWDASRVPTNTDNAVFDAAGTATTITIPMTTAGGLQRVGCVTLSANNIANRAIRNNSSGTSGALELNGIGGMLLANYSGANLTFQPTGFTSPPMRVRLATSGEIRVDQATAQITSYSIIEETNGSQGFIKTGPGTLYFRTNNTFTGSITNADGWLAVDDVGTFGAGVAPVYLSGAFGGITCGLDRSSGAPLANPIVISADVFIKNTAGTSGSSRTIPFSGAFSGSSGSLTIANLTLATGNTFVLRLVGSFSFGLPLAVGSVADTAGSFSVLQLYNAVTNGSGVQTFTGVISGPGSVRRQGATSAAGGTTIFTGDNTYAGGTLVTYGTLLVNNTTGTGTGSGSVTVTNQGVLGGYGSAGSTLVSLGGTIAPGMSVSNLNVADLTLGEGGNYNWQVGSATGTAGTAWDLVTVGGGTGTWTDAASSTNPFTIKLDSMGVTPTGWSSGVARDWVIIHGGTASAFDASHFAIDTLGFSAPVQGVFSLSVVGGDLHLVYTPAADIVINVPSGTQSQGQAGYPQLTGTFGVIKVGNGELVLTNAANNYVGSTKIHAGTTSIAVDALNGSGAFGAASTAVLLGNTTGNSNATLNINTAGVTMGRNLTVQSGSSGVKTVGTSLSSGVAGFNGDITLQDRLVLTAATGGEAAVSGQITGSGDVAKTGGGTVTLSGLNTYSGSTTLSNGTLNLNNRAGGGTFTIAGASTIDNTGGATVTLVNTALVWNANFTFTGTTNLNLGSGPLTLGGDRVVTAASNTLTLGGTIAGVGAGFTKLGAGTLALTTTSPSTYSGNTTLGGGLLTIGSSTTFGDGTGTLNLAGGNLGLTGTRNTSTGIVPNPINMTADTVIQNSTGAGSGTRNLPFGGGVAASAGTLTIRNITTGNFTNVMHVRFHAGGLSFTRPVVFDNSLAASTTYNTSQLGFFSTNGTGDQIFSGLISGPGAVTRSALTAGTGGTTILTGQNTFTLGAILARGYLGLGASSVSSSGVVVSGPVGTGTLEIDDDTVAGQPGVGVFAYGGARTIENRVWLNGPTNTVIAGTNDLTFAGILDLGGIAKILTVSNSGVTTISGYITNTAALTKAGPGKLVITADNGLRTNTTTVTDGTLLINNTTGSGTGVGPVIVTAPGILGGTGIIGGPVSGGGSVSPGASAGTLTLAGGLDLAGGGTYVWELAANSTNGPGSSFDVLSVTGGDVVLGSISKLSINFTGTATAPSSSEPFWQATRSWKVLTIGGTGTNSASTAFANILNGSFAAGSFTNYADASGNIILQFNPNNEPPRPAISSNIAGAGTGNAVLNWTALDGITYTVQYKTNLNQSGWLTLGTATASGGSATYTDTTGAHSERYYRIVWP